MAKIRAGALHSLILDLIAMADSKKYQHISLDAVKEQMDAGRIIEFLIEQGGHDAGLIRSLPADQKELLNAHFEGMRSAYGGNERRKWGVENSGILLVLAWAHEPLQHTTEVRDRLVEISG